MAEAKAFKMIPHCEGATVRYDMDELIRCKDCKHMYFADNRIPSEQVNVCGRNGTVVPPDWFCADGERREHVKPVTGSAMDWDGINCE